MQEQKQQAQKPTGQYIGSLLMVLGVLLLLFIYYPFIRLFFFPSTLPVQNINKTGFSISIPKIGAQAPVIQNVDPFNPDEYLKALQQGVAHAKGTALPEEFGTVYLFAHSSDVPWHITRYNVAFFNLFRLKAGDEIILTSRGKTYKYKVRETKDVWPSEVQYLLDNSRKQLVLQTCTPLGTSFKRLLVFADPV